MKTVVDHKSGEIVKRLSSGLLYPVYRIEASGCQVMWARFQFSDLAEAWATEISKKQEETFMLEYKERSRTVRRYFKGGEEVKE